VLSLVTGLSLLRNLLGLELLHLGLQLSPEGGPHIARFASLFEPYKCKQCAPFYRRTGLAAGRCCGRYALPAPDLGV
jgi:hypothetical protein